MPKDRADSWKRVLKPQDGEARFVPKSGFSYIQIASDFTPLSAVNPACAQDSRSSLNEA